MIQKSYGASVRPPIVEKKYVLAYINERKE